MQSYPQYGCFPRWPENGTQWIHQDDVGLVQRLIPSERLFRRERFDGEYYHYRYGELVFRLKPCMWLPRRDEGIDVGDEVEVIGVGMERDPFVGVVVGMCFVRRKGRILYRLRRGDQKQSKLFLAEHMKLLTQKQTVQESEFEHPMPKWSGSDDRLDVLDIDEAL